LGKTSYKSVCWVFISRFSQGEEIAVSLVYQVKRATTKQPMKNVGLFSKNVGDFLKNVGLFPKNVGDFLNYLRRFLCFVRCFFSFYVLFLLVLHVVFFFFMRSFLLMYVLSMLPLLLLIALLWDGIS